MLNRGMSEPAAAPPPPAAGTETPVPAEPDWDELPGPVRERILSWAAAVLGALPTDAVPASLARIARFTPAKRARAGATALVAALQSDAAFRAAVLEWAARRPAPLDRDEPGRPEAAADAAALAVLHRRPEWPELVDRVGRRAAEAATSAEVQHLRTQVQRLTERVRVMAAEQQSGSSAEADRGEAERLRIRLREQGVRVRAAEQVAAEAAHRREQDVAEWSARIAAAERAAQTERERASTAQEQADRAQLALAGLRESVARSRTTSDRRLGLLLTTVEGAAAGLRREWALQGGGLDPADALVAGWPDRIDAGESTSEPARLQAWLTLPGAHLIIDGYNVSKTGFGDQTLAVQRDRVIRVTTGIGARTGADSTVVFDGATVAVPPAVPRSPGRRTRVLFSPAGVIADDVIVDLVAAEPSGRVVVVVTSDRDVVRRVRRHGAKTADAAVFLGLVGG